MTFSLPFMWGIVCHPLQQHSVTERTRMQQGNGNEPIRMQLVGIQTSRIGAVNVKQLLYALKPFLFTRHRKVSVYATLEQIRIRNPMFLALEKR